MGEQVKLSRVLGMGMGGGLGTGERCGARPGTRGRAVNRSTDA